LHTVDVATLELTRPRPSVSNIGALGHAAIEFYRINGLLGDEWFNTLRPLWVYYRRMAGLGSELASHNWLIKQSAWVNSSDVDYEALSLMTMYRARDACGNTAPRSNNPI